jgi:hypothetical protein
MKNAAGRVVVLLATVAALYLMAKSTHPRLQTILQAGLLLLVWGDLITHVPRQNPTVSKEAYLLKLPPLEQMVPRPKLGESRAMLAFDAILKVHSTIVSKPFDSVLGVRLGIYHNSNLNDAIPKVDGFYALYLAKEEAMRRHLLWADGMPTSAMADFLSVGQTMTEKTFLHWNPNPGWMPMITAGQQPVFVTSEAAVAAMSTTNFLPRQVVYLPRDAQPLILNSNRSRVEILSRRVEAHRIEFEVEAEAPTLAVISQVHYHPWRAYVDEQPTKIWPANYAFQAVQIPPGQHRVRLVYRDFNFLAGSVVSGVSFMGCALAWAWMRRRGEAQDTSSAEREAEAEKELIGDLSVAETPISAE